MATVYSNINMTAMNKKQIKAAAQNVGILHDNSETAASLLTKVKAK